MATVAAAALLLLSTASAAVVSASSGTLVITASTTLAEDHVGNIVIETDGVTLAVPVTRSPGRIPAARMAGSSSTGRAE